MRGAEGGVAVENGDRGLERGAWAVEVARAQALAQQRHAVPLCLGPAAAVRAAPWSPDSSAKAPGGAQGLLAGDGTRGVRPPGLGVLAGRDDGSGVRALAGGVGALGRDAADLLVGRDLREPFGPQGGMAQVAGGELDSPDLPGCFIDPEVDLAPNAAFGTAVLARSAGQQFPGLLPDPPHSPRLCPGP